MDVKPEGADMTKPRDLSFLLNSPEYRQNAAFVTACYKEMLDRDVEAEELFRWCRQLDGIYSRKALIAALAGSAKFGNRFEIKEIEQYKKRAFIPRAIQHVINRLNTSLDREDKGCFGPIPRVHLRNDYPKYEKKAHTWTDELYMLSLSQVETLRNQIRQLSQRFGPIRAFGGIAEDLTDQPAAGGGAANTAFITSIDRIVNLIENGDPEINRMSHLLIPIPVPTENGITPVFDQHWSAGTKGRNPRRWLVNRGEGTILFLNKHEYPVNLRLSFHLTTLISHSAVRISQGQNSVVIRLRRKAARVTMDTTLLPGENQMVFQFIGTAAEAEEITNLAISRLTINGGRCLMACDMNRLGTGYYAAVFPDSKVRNVLHGAGYSEIECIRLYHDNRVCREKTTRFLQHDPNSSGDSFYVLKEEHPSIEQKENTPSLRLYIAKKLSEID